MNSYLDEISNFIENNMMQPDIILENLYNKHLKDETQHLHVTRSISNNPSQIFYSSPLRTYKKRSLVETTLDKILDLYHITLDKKRIIAILSAYISFFPNELRKIPEDIKSQLCIVTAHKILSSSVDESLMFDMISHGQANGLDHFLGELPDKGNGILQNALSYRKLVYVEDEIKKRIRAYGQIPQTISTLPVTSQECLFISLVDQFVKTPRNKLQFTNFDTLSALSSVIANFPELKKRLYKNLYKILHSEDCCYHWENAAYCFNQLIKGNISYNLRDTNKLIRYLINCCHNPQLFASALDALYGLTDIVSACDTSVANTLILTLCSRLKTKDTYAKTSAFRLMGALSHVIINLPQNTIDIVIDSIINHLPDIIDHSVMYGFSSTIYDIAKLKCIFENNPIHVEKILLALFNRAISETTTPSHETTLHTLFALWHGMLKNIKKTEIVCLQNLYQRFYTNEHSSWIAFNKFSILIGCFEHLPEEAISLVNFFITKLHEEDKSIRNYAIFALGSLHFSLKTLPDSGLEVLKWMNITLSRETLKLDDSGEHIILALGNMSNLLSIHPELIKDTFLNLCDAGTKSHYSAWDISNIAQSIYLLKTHLNHDSLTSEDKQKIFNFLKVNIAHIQPYSLAANILCLLGTQMNKNKIFTEKFMTKYFEQTFFYDDYGAKIITEIVARIAMNLKDQHQKQLSWACIIKQYMQNFATRSNFPHSMYLANALGEWLFHLKRREVLLEKLPKVLTTCIEEYTDEPSATAYKM